MCPCSASCPISYYIKISTLINMVLAYEDELGSQSMKVKTVMKPLLSTSKGLFQQENRKM